MLPHPFLCLRAKQKMQQKPPLAWGRMSWMWPPLYFPLPSDLTHVTAPSLLGHSSAYPPHQCPVPREASFYNYSELGQLLLILVEKGAEPEAILSLVVSGNSEEGFLGAPSHCRENPACCFEGSSTASHPRPTDRSPWRAA